MIMLFQIFAFFTINLCFYVVSCKEFRVYWNMPSHQCKTFDISFTYAAEEYGFTMNKDGNFRGDKITIFYDPGLFPTILNFSLEENNLNDLQLINNGLPQNGDIMKHLNAFEQELNIHINNTYYDGLAIIDMEQWGATWQQNFNNMKIYQIMTKQQVMERHPNKSKAFIQEESIRVYERAANKFLLYTLMYAKAICPYGMWGYYQYPQCFNPPGVNRCSNATQEDNNQMILVWRFSDAVYPSLYLDDKGTVEERALQIQGMVREGHRVMNYANKTLLNVPYVWYKYNGGGIIRDEDLINLVQIPKDEGADGVIIWGSSADFSTKEQCLQFKKYLDTRMGPAIKKILL